MSKKKQTKTTKKVNPEELFPPSLVGKKLKREKTAGIAELILGKSQELLEKYLETKNTEYLFKAIKEDNTIIQGSGINLSVEGYAYESKKKNNNFVDKHTVVWESIRHWQNLHNWIGDKVIEKKNNYEIEYNLPQEAKECLTKIGSALVIQRKSYVVNKTYGISHRTPRSQGTAEKIYVEIGDCSTLINTWTIIESVIKPIRKKYKNNKDQKDKLIDELHNVIVNNLGSTLNINIPISKKDVKDFDLTTVNLTIASILSHIHSEIYCEYCKNVRAKKISPRTIFKWYQSCKDLY